MKQFPNQIKEELVCIQNYKSATKDIIIVVHDQLDYLKACIESIQANTADYQLYIFDNGSKPETQNFLKTCGATVVRSEKNEGFILPNNRLAALGNSEYIILLNSDTIVKEGWDKSLIGWQQQNSDVAITGFLGGTLDENAETKEFKFGYDIDYVCGWAMCISRATYETFGLFDENLIFAYAEDSEFCLRLKAAGKRVYALHLDLVLHFENKTIQQVSLEQDVVASFEHNHNYVKRKWLNSHLHPL